MCLFFRLFLMSAFFLIISCSTIAQNLNEADSIVLGFEQTEVYLSLLKEKRVGVVGNQSSQLNGIHLVDQLIGNGIIVTKVFSPEHGFRGNADAGEVVKNERDIKTGISIISLYDNNKKPTKSQLRDIDVLLFDIQDVGVRFYTYISTLHYVMEAAAENSIPLIVLDRPNPNGNYVDGPILEKPYTSFVGMHPVPIVYGMTIGEYANMINGEGWLSTNKKCNLTVIPCKNYNRELIYDLPIAPSPNLPNMRSIYLYPSLCLFEGTVISVGRGTNKPFQIIGHPFLKNYAFSFFPESMKGAKDPKLKAQRCFGLDFTNRTAKSFKLLGRLDLSYLINFYQAYPKKEEFFNNYFNLLAGNSSLQESIKEGKTEMQIRNNWKEGIEKFKVMRKQYLLYP